MIQFGNKFRSLFASMLAMAGLGSVNASVIPTKGVSGFRQATRFKVGRRWESNTEIRKQHGIPTGHPGAKLARKAARRQASLATLR